MAVDGQSLHTHLFPEQKCLPKLGHRSYMVDNIVMSKIFGEVDPENIRKSSKNLPTFSIMNFTIVHDGFLYFYN